MGHLVAALLLLLGAALPHVEGWWDHGHMLIPTIVKLRSKYRKNNVDYRKVKQIENLMTFWKALGELPSKHDFVGSFSWGATLPDYMKFKTDCTSQGLDRCIADPLHSSLHYYSAVFKTAGTDPNSKSFSGKYSVPPQFMMNLTDFDFGGRRLLEMPVNWGTEKYGGVVWALDELEYRITKSRYETVPEKRFTLSGWLIQFWLWFHLIGDIHQPNHMAGLQGGCFQPPLLDQGGNFIKMEKKNLKAGSLWEDLAPKIEKAYPKFGLHQLWDSMGWHKDWDTVGANAPRFRLCKDYCEEYDQDPNNNRLVQDAVEIMKDYPEEMWAAELDAEIEKFKAGKAVEYYNYIGKETFIAAASAAYGPIAANSAYYYVAGCPADFKDKLKAFHPTDDYLKLVLDVARSRIAKAAYRAERLVNRFLPHFNYEMMVLDMRDNWQQNCKEFPFLPVCTKKE